MIEKSYDVAFVAQIAQREKQIQQNYRPVIGVHKWFARRPGTLFRALLLSEFDSTEPLTTSFFHGHDLHGLTVADPFMGGGSPILEANRLGCNVVGVDINPMAYWIVRQELAELDRGAFRTAADTVCRNVEAPIGHLYETTCLSCGNPHAGVKYFLWIKQQPCAACHKPVDLFPGYLLSKNQRHPNYVLVCPQCGSLNEVGTLDSTPGAMRCHQCRGHLVVDGPASGNRCACPHCGHVNIYPDRSIGAPKHRLFAMEYYCPTCKPHHEGRFFKVPDGADLARVADAEATLKLCVQKYIPDDEIPPGDETDRLHRWGYKTYRQLFNDRQLLGLETLAQSIASIADDTARQALQTVFSDTLRYQNMLCRYDSYALKVLDIFSVHGFPVGLIQCESALLGIPEVGSGGYRHFVEKYDRAKAYCERPFETYPGTPKKTVYVSGERIGARFTQQMPRPDEARSAYLRATSSETVSLPPASLDAVLTDPPYFGNVQYAELMDFCYVWLRRLTGRNHGVFGSQSTRTGNELTVNQTEGRDIYHFADGLSRVFSVFAKGLKPGRPFAFTYHHNEPEAYVPLIVALSDARLVCTVTLPCPAEMGASIHINGTQSSVVDSIFVCRSTGVVRANLFHMDQATLRETLKADLQRLRDGGIRPSVGDARCLLFGHLARLAIWKLRSAWDSNIAIEQKLARAKAAMAELMALEIAPKVAVEVLSSLAELDELPLLHIQEEQDLYASDEISF